MTPLNRMLSSSQGFLEERTLRRRPRRCEREQKRDLGADKRVKVFVLVYDPALYAELIADLFYSFSIAAGEVDFQRGRFVGDG